MNSRAILTLLLLLGAGCDSQSPAPPPPPATKPLPAAAPKVPAPKPPWPGMQQGADVTLATDLLAKNYYLVFDGSGSMNDSQCSGSVNKIQAARAAVKAFARTIPADANVGLLAFDSRGISERVRLAPNQVSSINAQIDGIRPDGGTPLLEAIRQAYARLTDQGRKQLGYGEYHLVVVTDGMATPETQNPTPVVNEILANSPVVIHTIGFCIGNQHALNQPGRTFYKAADNPTDLAKGLSEVLGESPGFDVRAFK